jgi:PAS domain S-box-containing protein
LLSLITEDGPSAQSLAFLGDQSEAARLIAAHDWSGSLGPIEAWLSSLRTCVSLIVHSPVPMVLMWGADGVMIYNDGYAVIAGSRHPDIMGAKVRDAWPEAADFNDNVMRVGLAGGTLSYNDQAFELQRAGKPDRTWLNLDYSPVYDESGSPAGVVAIVIETTDKVLAEERRAADARRLQLTLQQMPGFVALLSGPEHRYLYVNDAYVELTGVRDFLGNTVRELFPELEGQGYYELLDQVYETGELFVTRSTPVRLSQNDEDRFIDLLYAPMRDDDGIVNGIFAGGYDVTERHRAESALEDSEARLRFLDALGREAARSPDADTILATTTRMVGEHLGVSVCAYADMDADEDGFTIRGDWSAEGSPSIIGHYSLADFGKLAVEKLGAGEPLIVNDNLKELAPEEAATFQAIGVSATICMPLVKDGRLTALMAIHDKTPRIWSAKELAIIREVTERSWAHVERVGAEAELRASEGNFRTLARAMPNHVWTARPDGQLNWFNEQVYAYSGAASGALDGSGWTDLVHPDDLQTIGALWAQSVATGETYEAQFRLRRADNAWRWHIARAVPIRGEFGQVVRWIGTNTDIQDQKEVAGALADINAALEQRVEERTSQLIAVQDALRQAQKMEAVGQLTGGIAHDFNNLLTGISGSLEMLEKRLAEGKLAGVERYIDAAQGAARRAAALTQRLLAFSRRQTLAPKPTDVNRLVAGMEDLIRRSVGPNVELEVVGAGGLWTTRVDPSQLENSLLNLCINARDAMAPDGGRLTIETANKWLDERAAKERDLPPGQYVSLCVTDTGTGMTPEVRERAFDPFYTTKPLGEGTGLGLSMIYGFVRQSGGQVRIYSELGEGTTMCLYLPRHIGEAEADEAAEAFAAHPGHGETVLVIDDEAIVRMLIVDVLAENGYAALEAVDGPSGLRILQSGARIDLLITDVGLPGGMNGRQIADAARVMRPDLKVLFVTGYAENAVVGDGRLDRGMEVITKPFGTAALGSKIRDLIDRP